MGVYSCRASISWQRPVVQFVAQFVDAFFQQIDVQQNEKILMAAGKKISLSRNVQIFFKKHRAYPHMPIICP